MEYTQYSKLVGNIFILGYTANFLNLCNALFSLML